MIVAATQDGYRTEPERANIGMYPLNTNIFESLVRLTPDYQVEPLLAESWEFVDPNTWSFTLRSDVTFHDGTPLTSEAVAWSLGRIAAVGRWSDRDQSAPEQWRRAGRRVDRCRHPGRLSNRAGTG